MRSSITPKKPIRGDGIADLIGGLRLHPPRACEVRDVDAAGKGVDVGVAGPLRFVERVAAGKHDVGDCLKSSASRRWSAGGAPAKRRQLVHAVVYDGRGI